MHVEFSRESLKRLFDALEAYPVSAFGEFFITNKKIDLETLEEAK